MDDNFEIALSVIVVSLVMFLASLLFKDKEGDKPARLAFRLFYFFTVLFFFAITFNEQSPSWFLDLLIDLFVAITQVCLTVGILWRCQSKLPLNIIYALALVYFILDFSSDQYSVEIAYSFVSICSLISVHALLNRPQGSNIGDKGMAFIVLINAVLLLINIGSSFGFIDENLYTEFSVTLFIFIPAYMAGLTIFLFSSYMLDAHKELQRQATTDPLTNLYNRRFFMKEAKRLLQTAERHKEPVCVMMCDIDFFKQINDNYGHKTGDHAIKAFAKILQESLRGGDILARYGGEEFVSILTQTNKEDGLAVAERMREQTENLTLETERGLIKITASFGLCEVQNYNDVEIAINQADDAMYQAKSSGRNKVMPYQNALAW